MRLPDPRLRHARRQVQPPMPPAPRTGRGARRIADVARDGWFLDRHGRSSPRRHPSAPRLHRRVSPSTDAMQGLPRELARRPSPIPPSGNIRRSRSSFRRSPIPAATCLLDQFRPGDVDVFYTKSKLGPTRRRPRCSTTLRSFFRFAVNRDWLLKSPVSPDLKPPTGATAELTRCRSPTSSWTTSLRLATSSRIGVGQSPWRRLVDRRGPEGLHLGHGVYWP